MANPMFPGPALVAALTALLIALFIGACSAEHELRREHPGVVAFALDRAAAEKVVVAADETRRAAFAALDPGRLTSVFRGQALGVLRAQVERMRDRRLRREERDPQPALVFWDPVAAEAVLRVEAQQRLVTVDQPSPQWASIARQWWTRLAYFDREWWVVDQAELAPDQWRSP